MNRSVITIAFIFCFCVSAEPIRSMIGADRISIISQDGGTPLPEGVVAVEYIEGTGTQYIDTGIIPNPDIGFVIVASYTGYAPNYGRLFGTQKDGYSGTMTIRQSQANGGDIYIEKMGGVVGFSRYYPFDTNLHVFRFNFPDNSVSIDDYKYTYQTLSSSYTYSCWVFGNNGATGCAAARVYEVYCFSRIDESIVAHFIPVRVGDIGCMYEMVSGILFDNIGTGNFLVGPDKE